MDGEAAGGAGYPARIVIPQPWLALCNLAFFIFAALEVRTLRRRVRELERENAKLRRASR